MYMPYQTPMTPKFNTLTKKYADAIRKIHMDATDTYMVNGASKLARREYGMVNASGHTTMARLWANNISADVFVASGDRL